MTGKGERSATPSRLICNSGMFQEICANLQGNVSASVPDALQKAGLAVVKVQQLRPHTVVDVEEVVGVCAGVLHHLLWQGATGPTGESSGFISAKDKAVPSRRSVYRILQSASW